MICFSERLHIIISFYCSVDIMVYLYKTGNTKDNALARGKSGNKLNEDLVMNWKIKNLDYKSFLLQ